MKQTDMESAMRELIDKMKNAEGSLIGMMEPVFVSCDSEKMTMTVLFNLKPWMRNPVGILHGGITAAMMDNAMGMLAKNYTADGRLAPTVNMSIDYIRQIPITEAVVIKAQIVSCGNTLIRARAEARISGKDGVVASGVATYYAGGF